MGDDYISKTIFSEFEDYWVIFMAIYTKFKEAKAFFSARVALKALIIWVQCHYVYLILFPFIFNFIFLNFPNPS
jgi:hypothetical protein